MIHYYTTRSVPRWSWHREPGESKDYVYKRFCDKERVRQENETGFTSVYYKVTCPKCLELLIPKYEEQLNKMKATFEHERSGEN